jgi:site-specific recombinase XerD
MPRMTKNNLILIANNKTVTTLRNRMILREGKSEQTLVRYLGGVKEFTKFIGAKTPDEALTILSKYEDRTAKIDEYIDYMINSDRTGIDIKSLWYGAKKWFIANRINDIDWSYISRPKATSQIEDRIPTVEELRLILDNKVTLRDKSFYITCLSAGFRVGTALSLQVKDYKPIEELGMITVKGGAGRKLAIGKMYFTFLTPEARRLLEQYLKSREQPLSPEDPLFTKVNHKYNERFDFSGNVSRQWTILLKRAKLAEKIPDSRSYTLHAHTLRKFFQTKCKLKGCKGSFTTFWLGQHPKSESEEYLDGSYFRPELEKHLAEYRKVVSDLTVFEQGINATRLGEVEKNLKDKEQLITTQQKQISNLEHDQKLTQEFLTLVTQRLDDMRKPENLKEMLKKAEKEKVTNQ